jgi:hypothetical protein
MKRLVALLFIFAIAGQVSAGVCGCLGGETKSKHSCCIRKKTVRDTISAKGCCETNCLARQAENIVQDRTEPSAKIKFHVAVERVSMQYALFPPVSARAGVSIKPFAGDRLKYARPPDLYLRHHAFLI